MDRFRPLLEPFHYDASRHSSYLEQLGVEYPGLREDQWERVREIMERRSAAGGR
jgi:aminobenzoyl-glutamate utilization protein B